MTPERFDRITKVLQKRQPDLTVITDQVHKERNLAAIVRSCDAVGVDEIHCVTPEDGYQTYSGTSASADKWVNIEHHSEIEQPISKMRKKGFQILAANLCDNAVDFRQIDYTRPTALVLGAEIKGVSEFAARDVDYNVILPMVGMIESYNVSVACAIILLEAQRQRESAGLYESQRMSAELYKRRFFSWAHPTLANYCDRFELDYPEVDDEGEVKELSKWYQSVKHHEANELE